MSPSVGIHTQSSAPPSLRLPAALQFLYLAVDAAPQLHHVPRHLQVVVHHGLHQRCALLLVHSVDVGSCLWRGDEGWHQGRVLGRGEMAGQGGGHDDSPAAARDRSPWTPSAQLHAGVCACSAGRSGSWGPGCQLQGEETTVREGVRQSCLQETRLSEGGQHCLQAGFQDQDCPALEEALSLPAEKPTGAMHTTTQQHSPAGRPHRPHQGPRGLPEDSRSMRMTFWSSPCFTDRYSCRGWKRSFFRLPGGGGGGGLFRHERHATGGTRFSASLAPC